VKGQAMDNREHGDQSNHEDGVNTYNDSDREYENGVDTNKDSRNIGAAAIDKTLLLQKILSLGEKYTGENYEDPNIENQIATQLVKGSDAIEGEKLYNQRMEQLKRTFANLDNEHQTISDDIAMRWNEIIEGNAAIFEAGLQGDLRYTYGLDFLHSELDKAKKQLENLPDSSLEAYYYLHGKELLEKTSDYRQNGRIISVPYVENNLKNIQQELMLGRVVLLHGDTGTGKTEIAKLAARNITGKNPEVVRGHVGMESDELFGHMSLVSSEGADETTAQAIATINREFAEWKEQNPKASDEDTKNFRSLQLSKAAKSGVPVTEYVLGAVYRAAKDGNIVILDEVNYIPPGVIAELNDIMTKRPGEKITIQEDGVGPIEVAKGFGIILTGNIGDKYEGGRHEIDPALVDRLSDIAYNYLPQATYGSMEDNPPENKQLFQMLLCSICDQHGQIVAKDGDMEKFWNLAVVARISQMAFSGKADKTHPETMMSVASAPQVIRTKNCLSNRGVTEIIKQYTEGLNVDGKSLDYYIFRELIDKSTITDQEKTYYYHIAQNAGFFNEADGWGSVDLSSPDSVKNFTPSNNDRRLPPGNHKKYGIMDVVEAIYGESPKPMIWNDDADEVIEGILEAEQEMSALNKRRKEIEEKANALKYKFGASR
jgi:MoxR-like ATPase